MNMLLFLLLFHSADAEPMECSSPMVMFGSPSVNQVSVPVDVQPAVYMTDDDCSAPSYYELTLHLGETLIRSEEIPWNPSKTRLLEMGLADDLQSNTTYTFRVMAGDGWGIVSEIQFETGEGKALALEGNPTVMANDLLRNGTTHNHPAFFVNPAVDTDNLSIVMAYDADNPEEVVAAYRVWDSAVVEIYEYDLPGNYQENTERCILVEQRDGRGQRSERSESTCWTPQYLDQYMVRECSAVSVTGLTWFMPILALAAVRRRNSPGSQER